MPYKNNYFLNSLISVFLITCLCCCSMDYSQTKQFRTSDIVKTAVAQAIDNEMEFIKPNLEPSLQAKIERTNTKGNNLTGREIVELTDKEEKGSQYLNFCYCVNKDGMYDTNSVVENARSLISEKQYQELHARTGEIKKSLGEYGNGIAKNLPKSQQEDFFKDLKSLVVRSIVLFTAGIVYLSVPDVIVWGKVSAATAIAIAAGLVAHTMMTIYEKYRFDLDSKDSPESVEQWFKELLKQPKADYALTAFATTIAATISESPIVKGIVILVFASADLYLSIRHILATYNFDA